MRRRFVAFLRVFAATTIIVSCQGSDITAPTRDLGPAGKKGTGANPGPNATAVLSGGLVSIPVSGVLAVSSSTASFETPFGGQVPIEVDIPASGQVTWAHCVWNTDVGTFLTPNGNQDPVGLQAAKAFWDLTLSTESGVRNRLYFVYVDRRANGGVSWNHQALTRWFTWAGADKYMWEIEAGGESNLSLIQPVGRWDGDEFRISDGVIRLTRTYCGKDPKPEGCKPSRGKGARPTVVCRNDGLAFPEVPFVTTIQ